MGGSKKKKGFYSWLMTVIMAFIMVLVTAIPASAADTITVTLTSATGTYQTGVATSIDSGLTVSSSVNITGGTVNINGFVSGDVLSCTNSAGLSWGYNSDSGVLTLSGTASASVYQTALRSITFNTTSTSGTRTIEILLSYTSSNAMYYSGTGHFYQYVSGTYTWTSAKTAAEGRTMEGVTENGYLATITSAAENAFITDKLGADAWIGGSDLDSENTWKWVTGPESGTTFFYGNGTSGSTTTYTYANWNSREPNDSGSNEDYCEIYCTGDNPGKWNDLPNSSTLGYVVEYGYSYYSLDSAGGSASKTITIVDDVQNPTDPVINLGDYTDGNWTANSVSFTASGSSDDKTEEANIKYQYSTDGVTWSDQTTGSCSGTLSSTGEYTLRVRTQDNAGKYSNIVTASIKIDKINPVISSFTANATGTGSIDVSGSATDADSGMNSDENKYEPYRFYNGSTWSDWATATSTTFTGYTPNQQVALSMEVKDAVGNTASANETVYTLAELPEITNTVPQSDGSIILTIDKGDNPASTQYYIERSQDQTFSSGVYTVQNYATIAGTTVTVAKSSADESSGVLPAKTYYFRIKAKNGDDVETTYYTTSTGCLTVPEIPGAPTVVADSDSQLTVSWSAVDGVTGYDVYEDGTAIYTTGTSIVRTGIDPNTAYTYEIVAKNASGDSLKSDSTSRYTMATLPEITTTTSKQDGSIILTLDKGDNPEYTQYYIERSQDQTFTTGVYSVQDYGTLTGTTVTIPKSSTVESNGVLPATTYYFRIKAKNGDDVETVYDTTDTGCLTVPEIPGAPVLTALQTDGYGAKQIKVEWDAVTGATSYDVFDGDGGFLATVTPTGEETTLSYTDARELSASGALVPNTTYSYKVVSRNAGVSGVYDDGCSVYSGGTNEVTFATTSDVDSVEALSDGDVNVTLDEQDNPDTTLYYVEKSTNPDFTAATEACGWTDPGADHILTITGLDRGTTYYFRVKAKNSEDVETVYGDITGVVTTIPADVAGNVTVTPASSSQLNISWAAAQGATSYNIYYEDGTFFKNVTTTITSETGLAPNSGRIYKVYARNSSGTSITYASNTSAVFTYAVTPGLALTSLANGDIEVEIGANNNTDGTLYYVEYATDDGFSAPSSSVYAENMERTITGLEHNTIYYFHVKARNGNNVETSYSIVSNAKTTLAAPSILSAEASVSGTTHKVTVSWEDNGATSYYVYRDGVKVGTTVDPSYTDSGLKANKVYSYTVSAINDGGESMPSDSSSVRTLAEYPEHLTVSDKTKTSFTLNITPSSNLSSSEGYQVIIKDDATVVKTLSWSSDTSYQITGLDNSTLYDIYIDVRNNDNVERGAIKLLSVYCNRDVEGTIVNDEDVVRSEDDSNNEDFEIELEVWDPDADTVTVSAEIGGITRTVTHTVPATQPSEANFTLAWDIFSLPEGVYDGGFTVTVTDGNDSIITLTYNGTLIVDKTDPEITLTGDDIVYLETGDTYDETVDAGADVTGDDDNGLEVNGLPVDTSSTGIKEVTYISTDDAGNTDTVIRTVIVVEPVSESTISMSIPSDGIGTSSAVLGGSITTLGKTQVLSGHGFIWSSETITDGTDIDSASVTKISLGAKTDLNDFASTLNGLTTLTTYYVRPYVIKNGTAYLGSEKSFTTTAAESDTVRVFFSTTSYTVTEGSTDITVTVKRLGDDSSELSIPLSFDGTADQDVDYHLSGISDETVTIAAGDSEESFMVSIDSDSDYEEDETIEIILLSGDGYDIVSANGTSIITVLNDDEEELSSDNYITDFVLAGVDGTIDDGTITLAVPYGTDLTGISPDSLEVSVGATVAPSAIALRDFKGDVAYTVTAEDGSIKRYIVTVTVNPQSDVNTLSDIVLEDGEGNPLTLMPSFFSDTTEYTLNVSSDTASISCDPEADDSAADVVVKVNGTVDSTPGSLDLDYGDNTITIEVTAENGDVMIYTIVVTRATPGVDSNCDLVSLTISNGTLTPEFTADITDYNVNVANSVYSMSVIPVLSNSGASYEIIANGALVASDEEVALNVGANVFVITVTATDGTEKTYAISVSRAKKTSSGGSVVGGSSGTATSEEDVTVYVDGDAVSAGTQSQGTSEDGRESTTVIVDYSLIDSQIGEAGEGAVVTIPITGSEEVKSCLLDGQMVKDMENNLSDIRVETGDATYVLPAEAIDIDSIAGQFEGTVDLADIEVGIEIMASSEATVAVVANAAADGGFTIMVPAIDFSITATYNGQTVEISSFDSYVERLVKIPEGVDPGKITTGVIVDTDGTVRHVPTKVVVIDGVYYAVINSLTNSTYTVIYSPVEFTDVETHWAENAINDMGSRLIVSGVGNGLFDPDSEITRAEFAAIIVRALGLEAGTGETVFTDVAQSKWYAGYVGTASSYGIITGYDGATFGPDDTITREQAMVMIARAMAITGLGNGLSDVGIDTLSDGYADANIVSEYAKASIASCINTGVITGVPGNRIAPKENITRAQAAAIIQRLLNQSGLI